MDQHNRLNKSLFPTKSSFVIFISYISLFVSQGLLVTAVQKSQINGFNAIVVVLLTELVKLLICLALYLMKSHGSVTVLLNDVHKNRRLLLFYLVPSFLYCLYNNLTFINLELFDLTTYYCLMQFRIVLTAIIYQILFRRRLTLIQWTSLFILTSGCLLKEYGLYDSLSRQHSRSNSTSYELLSNTTSATEKVELIDVDKVGVNPVVKFAWLTLLLLFQMFCSCFAGVYNEYLLKDFSTSEADVVLQNIFMYLDSIFCNIIVYKIASKASHKSSQDTSVITTLQILLSSPLVVVLIFNNAFSGLVASFFLKSLNSILKTFASALELFAVAFLAWILFNDSVDSYTIIALLLVSAAMIVYSKNPVSVAPPSRNEPGSRNGFVLVPTNEEDYDH